MLAKESSIADQPKKRFSRSGLLFYLFAAVLFIIAAYYSATIKKDLRFFEEENKYWLGLAVAGQFFTYIFGAVVYDILLQVYDAKARLTLWELFQTTFVTLFLNQTIPSAGISGNVYFSSYLVRRGFTMPHALSLIFVELLSFYVAMEVVIIVAIVVALAFYQLSVSYLVLLAAGFLVYGVFAVAIGLLGRGQAFHLIYQKLTRVRIIKKLLSKLKSSLTEGVSLSKMEGLWRVIGNNKAVFAKAVFYQVCIFLADGFTIFALFRGLGMPLPLVFIFIGFILTRVISILPLSPGALILYESSMTFFYVSFGASLCTAVIVTLLYRVLSFWLPMPIGFLIYRRLQK